MNKKQKFATLVVFISWALFMLYNLLSDKSGYFKEDGAVYYYVTKDLKYKLAEADLDSFTFYEKSNYGYDKKNIYYEKDKIFDIKEPPKDGYIKFFKDASVYFVYGDKLFFVGKEVKLDKSYDTKNFKELELRYGYEHFMLVNGDKIILDEKEFPKVDLETFDRVKGGRFGDYFSDKNGVYLNAKLIKNADPATFECLKKNYGRYEEHYVVFCRDKNFVYKDGEILKGEDPKSFDVKKGFEKYP